MATSSTVSETWYAWYWIGGLIATMLAFIAVLLCFVVCIRPFMQSAPEKYGPVLGVEHGNKSYLPPASRLTLSI